MDSDNCIGRTPDEAIEFALDLGPAGEMIRFAGETGEKLCEKVSTALEDVVCGYVGENGSVWVHASAWFITANNPE